jgi:hypothetical protein
MSIKVFFVRFRFVKPLHTINVRLLVGLRFSMSNNQGVKMGYNPIFKLG